MRGKRSSANALSPLDFRHDVEDHASISSDDIAISPDLPVPDDDHCVVCPTGETLVAQRFSGDRSGVNTKKGWLEQSAGAAGLTA
jgi:hypothetical protein